MFLVWCNLSATPPHSVNCKALRNNICGAVAVVLTGTMQKEYGYILNTSKDLLELLIEPNMHP